MPEAHHNEFCPQCGCTKTLSDEPGEKAFECGEVIIEAESRQFSASYSCRTMPDVARTLEEALSYARNMLKTAVPSKRTMEVLTSLRTSPGAVSMSHQQLARARVLIRLGFADFPNKEARPDLIAITAWGIYALRYYEEQKRARNA